MLAVYSGPGAGTGNGLHDLVDEFRQRIEDLSLVASVRCSRGSIVPQDFLVSIEDLQNRIAVARATYDTERIQIERASNVLERLQKVKETVDRSARTCLAEGLIPVEEQKVVPAQDTHSRANTTTTERKHPATQTGSSSAPSKGPPELRNLTEAEFAVIPKYLVGRVTLQKMNQSLAELNKIFLYKHLLLKANPIRLNKAEKDCLWEHKQRATNDCPATLAFVCEDELKLGSLMTSGGSRTIPVSSGFKMDVVGRSLVASLRYLGKIRDHRGGGHNRMVVA
ncbi:hypothetical protein BJ742DRAFT_874116, partial [Cladochytrium replicatum]